MVSKPDDQIEKKVIAPIENYNEKAVSLVLTTYYELSSLPLGAQVKLKIEVAKLLLKTRPEISREALDDSLSIISRVRKNRTQVKEGLSASTSSYEAEIISIYDKLEPHAANEKLKQLLDENLKPRADNEKHPNDDPSKDTLRQANALAELGKTLLKAGHPQGLSVLISSLSQTGKVSPFVGLALKEAILGDKLLFAAFETQFVAALRGRTLGTDDLTSLWMVMLMLDDSRTTLRVSILNIILDSLTTVERRMSDAALDKQPAPFATNDIGETYVSFLKNIRPYYVKYLPASLKRCDELLAALARTLPPEWSKRGQQESQSAVFLEQLDGITALPLGAGRDKLLIDLCVKVVYGNVKQDGLSQSDMLGKVINAMDSHTSKQVVRDCLALIQGAELFKAGDYALTFERVKQISRPEWKGLGLLSFIESLAGKQPTLALAARDALTGCLEDMSPSKVRSQIAFNAAGLIYKYDPRVAKDFVKAAIKYANHVALSENETDADLAATLYVPFGTGTVGIGGKAQSNMLGRFSLSGIALTDWQEFSHMGALIEDGAFRAAFQLGICRSVLK